MRRQKSIINNEQGIALVMVMILSLIALATMSGLIYMVTSGTQISGIQKRYTTALEAGKAGKDVAYQVIAKRGDPELTDINFIFSPEISDNCRTLKLNQSTSNWLIGTTCPANSDTAIININDETTYDMSFILGDEPFQYTVYAKIIDTVEGNSSADEGLIKSGVVASNTGEGAVMSIPYLYTIEVDAQDTDNPAERARLSILYQY